MPSSRTHSVSLTPAAKTPVASRVRTQFNKLVKQLDAERKRLAGWHDAVPQMRMRAEKELAPLASLYNARRRELVFLLDSAYGHKQIKKKEREKLSDVIFGLAVGLLDASEYKDDELAAMVEKHGGGDPELDNDPDFLEFKKMIEEALGLDQDAGVGDDIDEPAKAATPECHQQDGAKPHAKGKAGERQAAEELRLKQSVRDIFRKLTSLLHPDREPDPAERERKTALMQRVNAAYAKDDLLGLLELQFEIDQIDQAEFDALPEERIKQYNKILTRQVSEVRHDIEELEHWLIYDMGLDHRGRITPAVLDRTLSADIADLEQKIGMIESDLDDFSDITVLKEFLKAYRIRQTPGFFGEDFY